ncbi:MAG: lipid-A-disaccharide synthase [Gammaproteobacteria bacterium]
MSSRPFTVAIVAGELSGDLLGRGLMDAIRARYPDARFVGIGGPQMIAAGCESWYPMERLAVMGLVEVLGRIFELLRIRADLVRRLLADRPDVFVGIDAPDFNLGVELRLRAAGVKTVHYVSPSVWAWRQGRVKKIRRAVDHMLTLLPFEAAFYREHDVPVTFVGHPLADMVPLADQQVEARAKLGIDPQATVLAMLPGSRGGEVSRLLPPFLGALKLLRERRPQLQCVLPAATPERRAQIESLLAATADAPAITLIDGDARTAMAASNLVLMASGTATLEGLLAKRPLVAAYSFNALTALIARLLVKTPWFSLPNLLAGESLVPELLQEQVNPQRIAAELARFLDDPAAAAALGARFAQIHADIRCNASARAADAVLRVAGRA